MLLHDGLEALACLFEADMAAEVFECTLQLIFKIANIIVFLWLRRRAVRAVRGSIAFARLRYDRPVFSCGEQAWLVNSSLQLSQQRPGHGVVADAL